MGFRASEDYQGRVLIIVPAYNEEQSLSKVVECLERSPFDYLIVNDGSTDNTPKLLDRLNAPHVTLVDNLGIGGAVQTGYIYAYEHDYDVAVQFDGDGQHDISYAEDIIRPVLNYEADICVGSRFCGNESSFRSTRLRRAGIVILSEVLHIATGRKIFDITSGFRAIGRRALSLFTQSYPTDYPEPESLALALANELTVEEIPVRMNERLGGVSSISGMRSFYYMVKVGLSILVFGSRKD